MTSAERMQGDGLCRVIDFQADFNPHAITDELGDPITDESGQAITDE